MTRPCAIGFSGNYPRALDGLARLLSLDMRVIDPAWIGMKLRKLLNYAEPLGHFMAFVPGLPHGERRQQIWPSTVAYIARLIIHRYAMLGVLDEEGFPLREMGVLEAPTGRRSERSADAGRQRCPECGNATVIHKDGCDFCTACGYVGSAAERRRRAAGSVVSVSQSARVRSSASHARMKVLVGTASWSSKSLVASKKFYPKEASTPEGCLRFDATQLPLVEVDTSYYAIPLAQTAQAWADRTPATSR